MPSNPDKERSRAYAFIDKIINEHLRTLKEGIAINELVRQTVIQFAIPPLAVRRFVKDCYIDTGYVDEDEGKIFSKGGSL